MKGGRIALPSEYFTGEQTGNYTEVPDVASSRAQMGCRNMFGPDLQVGGRVNKQQRNRRKKNRSQKKSQRNSQNRNSKKSQKQRSRSQRQKKKRRSQRKSQHASRR